MRRTTVDITRRPAITRSGERYEITRYTYFSPAVRKRLAWIDVVDRGGKKRHRIYIMKDRELSPGASAKDLLDSISDVLWHLTSLMNESK